MSRWDSLLPSTTTNTTSSEGPTTTTTVSSSKRNNSNNSNRYYSSFSSTSTPQQQQQRSPPRRRPQRQKHHYDNKNKNENRSKNYNNNNQNNNGRWQLEKSIRRSAYDYDRDQSSTFYSIQNKDNNKQSPLEYLKHIIILLSSNSSSNNNNNPCYLFSNKNDDNDDGYLKIILSLKQIEKDIKSMSSSSSSFFNDTKQKQKQKQQQYMVDVFDVCIKLVNEMNLSSQQKDDDDDDIIENLIVSILDSMFVVGDNNNINNTTETGYHYDSNDSNQSKVQKQQQFLLLLPILSKSQIQNAITVLSQKCRNDDTTPQVYPLFVSPLTYLIRYYYRNLDSPFETTAIIVGTIFLPVLNITTTTTTTDETTHSSSKSNKSVVLLHSRRNKLNILNTLQVLLCDSRQASALVGSLIKDVSVNGKEEMISNPLKLQLITALQKQIIARNIHPPNNNNIDTKTTATTSNAADFAQQQQEGGVEKSDIKALSCVVLAQIIDVMNKSTTMTGGLPRETMTTTKKNSTGLDLKGLEYSILSTLNNNNFNEAKPQQTTQKQQLKKSCLILLKSLLQFQPNSISGLVSKLILIPICWDGGSTSSSSSSMANDEEAKSRCLCCERCNTKQSDLTWFMQLVHHRSYLEESSTASSTKYQNNVDDMSCLAMICLTECIESMPWTRWLGGLHNNNNNNSMTTTRSTDYCSPPSSSSISHRSSGFGRRLVDSLVVILNAIRCNIMISLDDFNDDDGNCNDLIEAITQLAKSALLNLPFGKNNRLNTHAVNLIVTLSGIVFQLKYVSSSNSTRKKKATAAAFDVLVYSMGGWETPNGNTVPMCAPARTWLSNQQLSQSVLRSALQSAKANDGDNTDISIRFISAIFRTRPVTALEMQEELLELIQEFRGNSSDTKRFQVLSVLAALMAGRKSAVSMQDDGNSGNDQDGNLVSDLIVTSVIAFLGSYPEGDDSCSAKYHCLKFDTYASLLPKDWVSLVLSNNSGNDFNDYFNSIISHCHEGNAKVRISATKALAGFCSYFSTTQCMSLPTDNSFAQKAAFCVCETMLKNINDNNAGVRAISQFCIGDLGYAMHKMEHSNLIDDNTLLRVCSKVQEAMADQNDKVAGNSIRSIGYWGYLLSRNTSLHKENHERTKIQALVLESLNAKLTRALSLTSNEGRQIMTWKQRSVAKKHGWGAANAISLLFQYADLDQALFKPYFDILCLLVICVEKSLKLSEKIALSAIMAIRSLSPPQLSKLARGSGVVGNGIVTCLVRIYQAKETQSATTALEKVVTEYQLLLSHLLVSATVLDASTVLRSDEMSHSLRQYLYHWMVMNDSDGRSFQVFALAFQRPGLKETDVMLEQNFASRASQRDNPCNPIPITGSSEDDDADEL